MIGGKQVRGSRRRTVLAGALMATTALAGGLAFPALAEPASASAQRAYDIPAQPLSDGIVAFSRQAGLQVTAEAGLIEGRKGGAVSGAFAPAEALSRLLAGTGLTFRFVGQNTVRLEVTPQAAGGAIQLGAVRVEGSGPGDGRNAGAMEVATGPVDGYVARRTATATKTDTPILEVPQSISVIGRDEMDARGVQNTMDIVARTPGIAVNTYGPDNRGFEYILIRGFPGVVGNFRDGLTQASFGVIYYTTDPYGLERVEVLRGPSSVVYGQADAGGVINYISKRPTADTIREVAIQYGSFDRKQAAFDFGGAVNDSGTLAARIVGLALDSNDQEQYPDGKKINRQRARIAPSLSWRPTDRTSITVLGEWLKNTSGEDPYFAIAGDGSLTNIKMGDYAFGDFKQDQASIGYEFEHEFSNAWSFQQNARYSDISLHRRAIWVDSLLDDRHTYSRVARSWNDGLKQAAIDTRVQGKFQLGSTEHVILAGVDWSHRTGTALRFRGPAPDLDLLNPIYGLDIAEPTVPLADFTQKISQAGLYAQDQIKLGNRVVLTLGGRLDRARSVTDNRLAATRSTQTDHAFSGRAGFTYLAGRGWAPYLSYAESFQPTIGIDANNEPFEPTRGRQVELGVKFQPEGSRALFTAAVFDLTKTNVVTYDNITFDARQIGKQRSRGLELEAKAELRPGLNVTGSYTWLDNEVLESADATEVGKFAPGVPDQTASLWLDYTTLKGFGISGGARYVGKRQNDEANTSAQKGYWLFESAVHYDIGSWRFIVNAANLLNNKYYTICYHGECYSGEERAVTATVRYRW